MLTRPGAGACEGSVACSTCHVILSQDHYEALEEPGDDENDMLDMAFGLSDTSRLGCQVHLTKAMDGMSVQLPAATRNMFVDGAGFFSDATSAARLTLRRRTQADTPLECGRVGCVHVDTSSLCIIDICFLQLCLLFVSASVVTSVCRTPLTAGASHLCQRNDHGLFAIHMQR
jgi:hypothetical protein